MNKEQKKIHKILGGVIAICMIIIAVILVIQPKSVEEIECEQTIEYKSGEINMENCIALKKQLNELKIILDDMKNLRGKINTFDKLIKEEYGETGIDI